MLLYIRHFTATSQPRTVQLLSLQKPRRTFHLPPASPCTKWLQDFSPLPSSGSNQRQRFSKLVTLWYWGPLSCCPIHTAWVKQVARYDGRRNFPQLKWERIKGSLCPSQKCRGLLSASTLGALHLTCFLVPHRCRMTATFLISDPVAYSASCDLCRY